MCAIDCGRTCSSVASLLVVNGPSRSIQTSADTCEVGSVAVAPVAADELPDHGPQMARDLRDLGVAPDVSV